MSARESAAAPAYGSTANMPALTTSAIQSARRQRGSLLPFVLEHELSQQDAAICRLLDKYESAPHVGPVATTGSRAVGLRIGEIAKATGANVETVRYYERIGLLQPAERTSGNYRTYTPADVARLNFIRHARGLGFSIPDIRSLLNLADQPERDCSDVDRIATGHLQVVEAK